MPSVLQRELGQLFTFAPSGNAWIDAMQPGVSKASGIAQLMEHYGVERDEVRDPGVPHVRADHEDGRRRVKRGCVGRRGLQPSEDTAVRHPEELERALVHRRGG